MDVEQGKKAFYDAVTILVIFSLAMIIFSFIFGRVIHHLKKNDGLFLDKSLGVLFGIIRGSLFVCLGYIFIVGFIYDEKPDWIKGSTTKIVEIGSKQLVKLNPKNIEIDFGDIIPKSKKKDESGYSDETRQQIEDLINDDIL